MIILKRTQKSDKFVSIAFFAVLFCLLLSQDGFCRSRGKTNKPSPQAVTARAVYAVDFTNRRVIFSRNARMRFHPASTVKLLTALVVLDRMTLDDRVVIKSNAVNVQPTKAGLTEGASYSVSDLLKVLLATSANDAGVALAEAVAGSESSFANLMNKKAKAIGAKRSRFTNATGLPDNRQVTTAYDLSLITRAAFTHPFISSVMKQKTVVIAGSDGKKIERDNHNKLLWRISEPCVLGKTGYTRVAGHCYAGIAYYDDRRVSVVILSSRKPWKDIVAILGLGNQLRG